jgi:predicted NACHT family NTPase
MTLRLWEIASGRCLRVLKGHTEQVNAVAWSPDGRFILSGSDDKTLRLWDVASGDCATFEGHDGAVTSVAWSPDGRLALSGGRDDAVGLWEVFSERPGEPLQGHTDNVNSVAWSPDGHFALSASDDGTLRLWSISTAECLQVFTGHTQDVSSVAWSPDGCSALSASDDGTVRLWEFDWALEENLSGDWEKAVRPHLETFLTLHTAPGGVLPANRTPTNNEIKLALTHRGKPSWTEDDFRHLLEKLGCAGYGWLRPEGVRRELEKMAAAWQGPPPLGS